jgi:hypothetical protein
VSTATTGQALDLYQRSRVARTARIVLSGREMGRIYHAKGVERLVRNDLWKGRTPERFYDAMEWLYGWNVGNCLIDKGALPGAMMNELGRLEDLPADYVQDLRSSTWCPCGPACVPCCRRASRAPTPSPPSGATRRCARC